MKVLLTRPAADSARIARKLAEKGIECLIWPLTRIVPLASRVEVPAGTEALLFTSPNGVRAFADAAPHRNLPVLAVGNGTAAAARTAGFIRVASAAGDAQDLARLARETGWRRLLHPRGRDAARDMGAELAPDGIEVATAVLYAAELAGAPPTSVARALMAGEVDLVTVWSPRNGRFLADWLAEAGPPLTTTDLLAISENAALPLRHAGFRRAIIAAHPDADAMLAQVFALPRP